MWFFQKRPSSLSHCICESLIKILITTKYYIFLIDSWSDRELLAVHSEIIKKKCHKMSQTSSYHELYILTEFQKKFLVSSLVYPPNFQRGWDIDFFLHRSEIEFSKKLSDLLQVPAHSMNQHQDCNSSMLTQ